MIQQPKKKDRVQAKAWMVLKGIRQVDIQRSLRLKYDTQVHETLIGVRSDRRVLRYLLEKGCPPEYLDLPKDMRKKWQH